MLAGLLSYLKQYFILRNQQVLLSSSQKFELKKTPDFHHNRYFNQKIVGNNRSSKQILTETVCWVPLLSTSSFTKTCSKLDIGQSDVHVTKEIKTSHFTLYQIPAFQIICKSLPFGLVLTHRLLLMSGSGMSQGFATVSHLCMQISASLPLFYNNYSKKELQLKTTFFYFLVGIKLKTSGSAVRSLIN